MSRINPKTVHEISPAARNLPSLNLSLVLRTA